MEVLFYYFLFALTTAIASCYELFYPVLKKLKESKPELNVAQYSNLTLGTFAVFSFAVAPLLIFPCLIPSMGVRFRSALQSALEQQ